MAPSSVKPARRHPAPRRSFKTDTKTHLGRSASSYLNAAYPTQKAIAANPLPPRHRHLLGLLCALRSIMLGQLTRIWPFGRQEGTLVEVQFVRPTSISVDRLFPLWQPARTMLDAQSHALADREDKPWREDTYSHRRGLLQVIAPFGDPPEYLVFPYSPRDFYEEELQPAWRCFSSLRSLPVKPNGFLRTTPSDPRLEVLFLLQAMFPGMIVIVTRDAAGVEHHWREPDTAWLSSLQGGREEVRELDWNWLESVNPYLFRRACRREEEPHMREF